MTILNQLPFSYIGGVTFKIVDHFAIKTNLFYDFDSLRRGGWSDSNGVSGNVFGIRFGFSGFIY